METVGQRMVEASRSWSERQGWGAPLAFLGHERQLPGITPSALDDRNGVGTGNAAFRNHPGSCPALWRVPNGWERFGRARAYQ